MYIRLYIWRHSSCNASYRLALPGLVFLANEIPSATDRPPVNLPLSHTRIPSPLSWQSCCFSALLLATPAAVLIFMVVIFSLLSFMETMSEILEGLLLWGISARCVCVLTRLLVRRSSAYLSANNLCLQTHMCVYTYTVYFTHTYAVYLKIKLIFTQLKLFSRIITIGCVADCVLNDGSHFKTKAAQFI